MACKQCEERRQRMRAYIAAKMDVAKHWAQVRRGEAAAVAPSTGITSTTEDRPSTTKGSAENAGAAHRKRAVVEAEGAGTGAGQLPVPRLRKDGSRKAGAG